MEPIREPRPEELAKLDNALPIDEAQGGIVAVTPMPNSPPISPLSPDAGTAVCGRARADVALRMRRVLVRMVKDCRLSTVKTWNYNRERKHFDFTISLPDIEALILSCVDPELVYNFFLHLP